MRTPLPLQIDSLEPSRTAVIVVDMQNDFVVPGSTYHARQATDIAPRLAELLSFCRENGILVIYTAHEHRSDGCDLGVFGKVHPLITAKEALVAGTEGVEIYPSLAPAKGEHVIRKHRYSGFFGTDLDVILRSKGIESVVITGTTTENCCHATARDAMFLGYEVAFIADLTGTTDYPDTGWGAMPAEDVHASTLTILSFSTAHVMDGNTFKGLVAKG